MSTNITYKKKLYHRKYDVKRKKSKKNVLFIYMIIYLEKYQKFMTYLLLTNRKQSENI